MIDLTPERLNELEDILGTADDMGIVYIGDGWHPITLVGELRALSAMARAKQAAERERDEWRAFAQRTEIWDAGGCCACCGEEEGHTGSCLWRIAALAQPTDAGGE